MSTPVVETNDGRVTSWLPMTTAGPALQGCSKAIYGGGLGFLAFDPFYGMSIDRAVTCLPAPATAWWNQNLNANGGTTISLGPMVCPADYTTAYTSVINTASTIIGCCPKYVVD